MKVLLVVTGTDIGGTEMIVSRIARTLSKRRHHVEVLSLKRPGPIAGRIAEAGIDVSSLEMDESVTFSGLVRSTAVLTSWLRRRQPDVIHSFLPRANVMSRIANRLSLRPVPHIANEESTSFGRARGSRMLNRVTAGCSERVVAVCGAVRDVIARRDGVPYRKIVVIPTGIELDVVDGEARSDVRTELRLPDATRIVCSVGRLVPDKAYPYLIRALAGLPSDVHLVLVGGGPEEARLRAEAASRKVEHRVHLLGFRRDAVGIMKSADLFVLSSVQEGFPVVLLEAMACGRPIVASDVGGVGDLVRHGETGLLVPPVDVWEPRPDTSRSSPSHPDEGVALLADAMRTVLSDRETAARFGASGRRLVEEVYTLDEQVSSLEALYAWCLNGRAGYRDGVATSASGTGGRRRRVGAASGVEGSAAP